MRAHTGFIQTVQTKGVACPGPTESASSPATASARRSSRRPYVYSWPPRRHGFTLDLEEQPWGSEYYLREGRMMPENGHEVLATRRRPCSVRSVRWRSRTRSRHGGSFSRPGRSSTST